MRLISLFRKTVFENLRDWKILILTLAFGPFFVALMYFYLGETTNSPYRVMVVNRDEGESRCDEITQEGCRIGTRDSIAEPTAGEGAERFRKGVGPRPRTPAEQDLAAGHVMGIPFVERRDDDRSVQGGGHRL